VERKTLGRGEGGGGATLHKTLPRLGMFFGGKLWAFSLLPCSPTGSEQDAGAHALSCGGGRGLWGGGPEKSWMGEIS
jgi:hypothetical protein